MDEDFLWIARDLDGKLYFFEHKPFRQGAMWIDDGNGEIIGVDSRLFPTVKWEDKEPTKVILKTTV